MTKFRCTNCLWEGTLEEMDYDGMDYYCPNCVAPFTTDGAMVGPWEVSSIEEDPEDTDYGDFDEEEGDSYDGPY